MSPDAEAVAVGFGSVMPCWRQARSGHWRNPTAELRVDLDFQGRLAEHLVALASRDGRRSVVIANAMDDAPPEMRRASVELELTALADLGLGAAELDLRGYFGQQQRLRQDLAGVAWPGCAAATPSCSAMPFTAAAPTPCSGNCLPLWDGMVLLGEAFVPHYRSPGHPETAAIERAVTRYRAEGIAYRTLHDGQSLLINGPETKIV